MDKVLHDSIIRKTLVIYLVFGLMACTSINEQPETNSKHKTEVSQLSGAERSSLRSKILAGKFDQALADIEEDTSDNRNVFMYMNRGMLRRMTGDYAGSNQSFEKAKTLISSLYGLSISEKLGSAAFSDVINSYAGYRYEQVLLHAYMAMNYAQLNDMESARVEILQADLLMSSWSESAEDDPFVRYLSGLIFDALGEQNEALIAYRKSIVAYKNHLKNKTISKIPPMVEEDLMILLVDETMLSEAKKYRREFKSTYSAKHEKQYREYKRNKNYGELVIILNYGVAPARIDESDLDFYKKSLNQDEPDTPHVNEYAAPIRDIRASSKNFSVVLEIVEDIDVLAKATQYDLSGTGLRVIAKTIEGAHKYFQVGSSYNLKSYLEYIREIKTRVADKRSWVSLPNKILMNKLLLPTGEYNIVITMPNEHGYTETIATEKITVKHGAIMFASMHAVAPRTDKELRNEADTGEKNALYKLAERLKSRYGVMGVDALNENALLWYIKAAESEHVGSQLYLSRLYKHGLTERAYVYMKDGKIDYNNIQEEVILAKDGVKALYYLTLASDNHHPLAMRYLANTYEKEWDGAPIDLIKSLKLYKEIDLAIETDKYLWSVNYPWDEQEIWGYNRVYFKLIKDSISRVEQQIKLRGRKK